MEIHDLTDEQVDLIINELKAPLVHLDNNLLNTPFGKISITSSILSDINNIKFKLDIHRGNREPGRFTLNLRFSDTNDTLVRLDVNGGPHGNPDGTTSPSSHIHIYNNDYHRKDSYAYPVDLIDFPNIQNLYNASVSFLDYTNITNI